MSRKIFVRNPYNYDADDVSRETGVFCDDESLTVQSETEDADINTIVKRFGVTGVLPEGVRTPTYGDFSEVFDFHSAQNAIVLARESFMEMPAEVRARFRNDPGEFVAFCSDPENLDEMRKLGLAIPAKMEDTSSRPADPPPDNLEKDDGTGKPVQRSGKNARAANQASAGESAGE